jgi:hypothetical protein
MSGFLTQNYVEVHAYIKNEAFGFAKTYLYSNAGGY